MKLHRYLVTATVLAQLLLSGCSHRFLTTELPAPYVYAVPDPVARPGGLRVTFFGTTTLLFSDGTNTIMIDGFVSRPDVSKLLFARLKPNEQLIADLIATRKIPERLDRLFVTHAHHDHAMDSAILACATQAKLSGPPSVMHIVQGEQKSSSPSRYGKPCNPSTEMLRRLPESIGQFSVTHFEAVHSPLNLFAGKVRAAPALPSRIGAYRSGEVTSYVIQHQDAHVLISSGHPKDPESLKGQKIDLVFLSIGGLGPYDDDLITSIWKEVVRSTQAKVVVLTHWDDFTLPLNDGLRVMPRPAGDFNAVMTVIQRLADSDAVTLLFLPALKSFDVKQLLQNDQEPRRVRRAARRSGTSHAVGGLA